MKTTLTTSESVALDVIRVVAASVVAYAHLAKYFSNGWANATVYARFAVIVFFVLSGFVIRYVTCRRSATLGRYLSDRASRIYSVAVPALLFTLLTDTVARHINPASYAPWEADYTRPLLRIVANLLLCGRLWRHAIIPLSDGLFWSVNFEIVYYILYGCWFYLTGIQRWLWMAGICLFFGPRVLYLAPLWVLGCVLHDLYQYWNDPVAKPSPIAWWWLSFFAALFAFGVVSSPFHHSYPWFSMSLAGFSVTLGVRPSDFVYGFIAALVFLLALYGARQLTLSERTPAVRWVRFLSEGTFPIYLLHFPLYVLIAACIPYDHAAALPKLIIFASAIILGVLAGHPCNILKDKIRAALTRPTASPILATR